MPTFVGRAVELARLRARHEQAAAGDPRTVVIEGAPGVGKTALVQAFLAGLDPHSVLMASGDEGESFLSFGVLEQLLGATEPSWTDPFAAGADLLHRLDESAGGPTVFVV